jgi:O-antigen ligase
MALLSASATLFVMVGLCMAAAMVANSRRAVSASMIARLVIAAGGMAVLVAVSPYAEEFTVRVADIAQIDNEANISSVVYVNGWESAMQNLRTTQGFGLGFNRMGCDPRPETTAGTVLEFLEVADLNYNDGSFIVAKMLSELGLVGAALWLIMLAVLLRMARRMRLQSPRSSLWVALAVSAVTVITLGALVRGTNYFSGPFLLGLYFILSSFVRQPESHSALSQPSTQRT